jgi:hypothetical protein
MTAARIAAIIMGIEQRRERARRGTPEPTPLESMAQSTPAPLGETAVAGCVESATDCRERPATFDNTTAASKAPLLPSSAPAEDTVRRNMENWGR